MYKRQDGLFFEFDYYDFFEVTKDTIISDENIWRCNLLGGNRVNKLIEKLSLKNNEQTSLKNYLLNNLGIEKKRYCEGYMTVSYTHLDVYKRQHLDKVL